MPEDCSRTGSNTSVLSELMCEYDRKTDQKRYREEGYTNQAAKIHPDDNIQLMYTVLAYIP